jgi:cation/acetate symporter
VNASPLALAVFALFVGIVLGLSFWLGRTARSAQGYYAAHGEIPWFINGIAFAGDYLSAASFLGICGMIAFYGYDGFLYSIGYLAGWVVALFVIAEPLKRLGRFTFADALDARFQSRAIKITAAVSTLVVSVFYLIPQMVGAGALITPLLGLAHHWGVLIVGVVVIVIVATAGMVSTTWVQFIKGSLLVVFCAILTVMILVRGLAADPGHRRLTGDEAAAERQRATAPWPGKPYLAVADGAATRYWRDDGAELVECRLKGDATTGTIASLPGGVAETGPLGPLGFLATLQGSQIVTWAKQPVEVATTVDGREVKRAVFAPAIVPGAKLLTPGQSSTFKGIASDLPVVDPAKPETRAAWRAALFSRLDFISLMLALFCGTASLPHILIRYYTVKDQASARKSTVVGIAAIGFFYVLTLFLGLAALTSGVRPVDPTDSNMAAPLLAKAFGELPFAVISAIAFTTVLGTVAGLIMAASGAIVHDLMTNWLGVRMDDAGKVRAGKIAAVVVGVVAMGLGVLFKNLNVTFLVGWAFNIAASANLPALIMLLFWPRTTKQGISVAITVGLASSLAWVLLSKEAFQFVYGYSATDAAAAAVVPFSQPGLITIPLGFAVLVIASLLSPRREAAA